jgi:Holliday junction resolvase RusA-like endonuclease
MRINIKPLSVNLAWKGRRFKTEKYKSYEKAVLLMLPKIVIPQDKIKLIIEVGYSNKASDIDNCLKPFIDILQKKYRFNDNKIYELAVKKVIVKKNSEFISFEFKDFE